MAQSAGDRLAQISQDTIEKLLASREVDDIGTGDQWSGQRMKTCEDDYTYDLAVEVRKAREQGSSWWRIAYDLELPGFGHSAKQGRLGASLARRLWRAAWGKTYDGMAAIRETKEDRVARSEVDDGKPYFHGDENEMDIVKAVAGKQVEWCTRLPVPGGIVASLQSTYVHGDVRLIFVKVGPKGRYVEFYEQSDPAMLVLDPREAIAKAGPLRSVYLDRITKVGA